MLPHGAFCGVLIKKIDRISKGDMITKMILVLKRTRILYKRNWHSVPGSNKIKAKGVIKSDGN